MPPSPCRRRIFKTPSRGYFTAVANAASPHESGAVEEIEQLPRRQPGLWDEADGRARDEQLEKVLFSAGRDQHDLQVVVETRGELVTQIDPVFLAQADVDENDVGAEALGFC